MLCAVEWLEAFGEPGGHVGFGEVAGGDGEHEFYGVVGGDLERVRGMRGNSRPIAETGPRNAALVCAETDPSAPIPVRTQRPSEPTRSRGRLIGIDP